MQTKTTPKRLDFWIKFLGEQELPALCSTVRNLELLADDDVSPLANLGRSVMHDNALTTRILRVANSVTYHKGGAQITTLSRAAVVLGFDVMRNICLTAKLLSTMVDQELVDEVVYKILLTQMARSFQAAMIGRMMQQQHSEHVREEVFIASLLFHLGETAFWSSGLPEVNQLACTLQDCSNEDQRQQAIKDIIGGRFKQLTLALVTQWGLGDMLQKALSPPRSASAEVQSITKANELSVALSEGERDKSAVLIAECAELLGEDHEAFERRLELCLQATTKLSKAYGASELGSFLCTSITPAPIKVVSAAPAAKPFDQQKQLQVLSQLAALAGAKSDFNPILQLVLEGLVDGVGLNRACVLLLSKDKRQLTPKMAYGDQCLALKAQLQLSMADNPLLGQLLRDKTMMYYQSDCQAWHQCLPPQTKINLRAPALGALIKEQHNQTCCLGAIVLENKAIGLVYCDSHLLLTEQQVQGASLFWQQANLCLNLAYQR
ncbi:HDOD domain-containing protein [Shewanella sp. NIFS-20-20]|uniref:HDOD domain-containing protein n=1 Tax=Shewanella sp. NIFS-20-20 TaxID=2853806 RepID=UPI001C4687DF|nr:HDOD domain-containing protein [Shewanella sp. NIFS-20-20]MBV7317132.1 HDOD domain-containing protein [Shewanella sp. NIFS-20-20]